MSNKNISDELLSRFNTVEGRKELIELYKNLPSDLFSGTNEDGEEILLSVSESGITLETKQKNGWCRVNYYDSDGEAEGETFDGKWNKSI